MVKGQKVSKSVRKAEKICNSVAKQNSASDNFFYLFVCSVFPKAKVHN
jgi:hypothetical protein